MRRLTDAAVAEIRAVGYQDLSIRDVARRAEVAAATAYTYFASKDHLLTEVFWSRLQGLPAVDPAAGEAKDRVIGLLTNLALLVCAEPELAEGCTAAMFGTDPNVRQLRVKIGAEIHDRLDTAAGCGNPAVGLLELAYFGAMVQAGLGYASYGRMADRLAEAAELILS